MGSIVKGMHKSGRDISVYKMIGSLEGFYWERWKKNEFIGKN